MPEAIRRARGARPHARALDEPATVERPAGPADATWLRSPGEGLHDACAPASWTRGCPSRAIASDERVVFFPSIATASADGWRGRIRGWIYEPATSDEAGGLHATLRGLIARRFDLSGDALPAATTSGIYASRAALFLADNERMKRLEVDSGQVFRHPSELDDFALPAAARVPAAAGR